MQLLMHVMSVIIIGEMIGDTFINEENASRIDSQQCKRAVVGIFPVEVVVAYVLFSDSSIYVCCRQKESLARHCSYSGALGLLRWRSS